MRLSTDLFQGTLDLRTGQKQLEAELENWERLAIALVLR